MHLKRLEMSGFKSFADRTRLEFEPGITAIVGPNGCGKSNVVDALRWCLGEMSAKSLRSKVLMDVIFNGSANRPPTNMAEVSLTFDNSQNRLPIDFSEVTITRRLFRSGESEYFLNKTQCRLKDIRELFLDTGIGDEGYSIMEQGRVEYLLNARPEERRELFEEAAGVSKYKARREEALRKVDRTQLDLDRLSDVIAMTKEQMDKIEASVRKARQYQKLADDLKSLEIAQGLWEISHADRDISTLREECRSLEDALQEKITLLDKKEAALAALRLEETELGEKFFVLSRHLSEIDGNIGLSEQRQKTAEEREVEIRQRETILDRELLEGKTRLQNLEERRAALQERYDAEKKLSDEMAAALSGAEEAHRAKRESQKGAEALSRDIQNALWSVSQEGTRIHNDMSAQKSLAARLETELKALQKDKSRAEEEVVSLESSRGRMEVDLAERETQVEELRAIAESKGAEVEALEATLESLAVLISETQEKFFREKARVENLDQKHGKDPYVRGAQALAAANLPGIHGPLGKLIQVNPGEEDAVRRILGSHLNDLAADTLEDAQAAVRFLAAENRGRVRIWVLDRLSSRVPASGGLLPGQKVLLEAIRTEPRFESIVHRLLAGWITSEGTLYGEGLLDGGSDLERAPLTDLAQRDIAEREMGHLSAAVQSLRLQKSSAESAKSALKADWEAARRAYESASAQRSVFTAEREKQNTQNALKRDEIALIEADLQKTDAELSRAAEETAAMERALADLKDREEKSRAEWHAAQETLQARQTETADAASTLAVVRERAESQNEKLRWQENQLAEADGEFGSLSAALEAKSAERASSEGRIQEQQKVREESKRAVATLQMSRRGVEMEIEGLHTQRQDIHARLSGEQNAVNDLRAQTEDDRSVHQDKKLKLSHAEFKREATETLMKDKYGMTPLEAQERYGLPENPVDGTELERLRRRVEAMGPVNLAAPEEHAQLTERYNFLLSQQQDLLKAKDDLLATIQKINATTRQNFRETFERVRENFKLLYGQLFQGGETDLRLTDGDDILNAGVEIYAQPPGKKLQNIALLSGGEKALTAVALLFAFFMVRPAPFAVLDEVDAPLDEANVTRFITLIKAFIHQSQFLIISHNKRTMETADTLYGVTMETLGVSNILSARLKKEGSTAETMPPETALAAFSGTQGPAEPVNS